MIDTICAELIEICHLRHNAVEARKRLQLQIKALLRRIHWSTCEGKTEVDAAVKSSFACLKKGEPVEGIGPLQLVLLADLVSARALVHPRVLALDRLVVNYVLKLPPIVEFIDSVRGLGYSGVGQIIGCTGNLSNYAGPAKVWKRMGLAVMPDGRQRKHKDKELAKLHGFSPQRRAVIHTIGDSAMRQQSVYRDVYDERKEFERKRNPEMSDQYSHNRALRYMEKRILRDLWRVWRDAYGVR